MLSGQGQSASLITLLAPVSCANTAAATTGWIDVRGYMGDMEIIVASGAVTGGTVTVTIEDATDSSGTGAAALVPLEGAYTQLTTAAPTPQKRTIHPNKTRGFIRVIGTIVTGPAIVGIFAMCRPKGWSA